MVTFWKVINKVIEESDVILEILDARYPEKTRNLEIENKVKRAGKKLVYVLNKCDLAPHNIINKAKNSLKPCVFVSATDKLGTKILKETILRAANFPSHPIRVGIVGYPNTGKSSLINALGGHGKAKASAESGYTKGEQMIRISQKIKLIDTPGVIPYKEKDEAKHALIGSTDFSKVKDAEDAVYKLMKVYKKEISEHYNAKDDEIDAILEEISIKYNNLKKGGVPHIDKTARMILKDWQRGVIKQQHN